MSNEYTIYQIYPRLSTTAVAAGVLPQAGSYPVARLGDPLKSLVEGLPVAGVDRLTIDRNVRYALGGVPLDWLTHRISGSVPV